MRNAKYDEDLNAFMESIGPDSDVDDAEECGGKCQEGDEECPECDEDEEDDEFDEGLESLLALSEESDDIAALIESLGPDDDDDDSESDSDDESEDSDDEDDEEEEDSDDAKECLCESAATLESLLVDIADTDPDSIAFEAVVEGMTE